MILPWRNRLRVNPLPMDRHAIGPVAHDGINVVKTLLVIVRVIGHDSVAVSQLAQPARQPASLIL